MLRLRRVGNVPLADLLRAITPHPLLPLAPTNGEKSSKPSPVKVSHSLDVTTVDRQTMTAADKSALNTVQHTTTSVQTVAYVTTMKLCVKSHNGNCVQPPQRYQRLPMMQLLFLKPCAL